MRTLAIITICLTLGCLASVASAEAKTGYFWATEEGDAYNWNVLVPSESGGTGYTHSGPWYQYPSNTPQQDLGAT